MSEPTTPPDMALECPECGEPAIPPSGWARMAYAPTWCEDDEADCPGCGVHLAARIVGDDGEGPGWIEAQVVERDP